MKKVTNEFSQAVFNLPWLVAHEEGLFARSTVSDVVLANLAPAFGRIGERLPCRVPLAAGFAKQSFEATLDFVEAHPAG